MATKTQKWILAGKLIAENPSVKVRCPECEKDDLAVQDIKNVNNPLELERIMHCTTCGARNILRLRR